MIADTGSDVGKSVIGTAFYRMFLQDGTTEAADIPCHRYESFAIKTNF